MLKNGVYPGIATHDKPLIDGAYKLIEKYNVPKNMYEFQMLYGVTPELRKSIVTKGHTMRVYVPFGKQWFGYSTRRLKENPKMASHIMKALFFRGQCEKRIKRERVGNFQPSSFLISADNFNPLATVPSKY